MLLGYIPSLRLADWENKNIVITAALKEVGLKKNIETKDLYVVLRKHNQDIYAFLVNYHPISIDTELRTKFSKDIRIKLNPYSCKIIKLKK